MLLHVFTSGPPVHKNSQRVLPAKGGGGPKNALLQMLAGETPTINQALLPRALVVHICSYRPAAAVEISRKAVVLRCATDLPIA